MSTRLPTFLLIGAARAGTTSIHHYLNQHADVFLSPFKEPTYFEVAHRNGRPYPPSHPYASELVYTWERYLELFENAGSAHAVGEASAGYLASPQAPRAIFERLPMVLILAVLRHPVDRAYSQFLMFQRMGIEPEAEFEAALAAQQRRLEEGWLPYYQYTAMSMYGASLARYYALFPRGHIRLFRYEDLCADPSSFMRVLFATIGVDPDRRVNTGARLNAAPRGDCEGGVPPADLPAGLRRSLMEPLRADIALLERLSGQSFAEWLDE